MKKIISFILVFGLVCSLFACTQTPPEPQNPDTPDTDTPSTDNPGTEQPDEHETPAEPYTLDFEKDIKKIGRTYISAGNYMFDWTGSGMEFKFNGTSVKATMGYLGSAGLTVEATCFVDGERTKKVELTDKATEYVLAEGLENTEHTVRIVKSAIQCTTQTFASKVVVEGKILPAPEAKDRYILALGDSLSAGRGVLGDANSNGQTRNMDDCTYATPWLIAEHFDADLELIADTGYGIYQSSSGNKTSTIPRVWRYLSYAQSSKTEYDYSQSEPDIIIINLGTNDEFAKTDIVTFRNHLKAFLMDIRKAYPDTPILYYYGMLRTGNYNMIKNVINEFVEGGDENLYLMKLDDCSTLTSLGIMPFSHPNPKQYEYYAEKVQEKISEIMGW